MPINLKNAKTGRTLGSSIQLKQVTLAKIFSGNITNWNHPEILKDNPRIATAIPATPITVSYRSDASGTTNNFLQYLNAWAPSIFPKVQDDMGTAFPGGKPPANSVAGKGNSGVMANVLAKEGTIGYVDLGDAKGYPSARIQNAKGEFIAPSSASAAKNLANQTNVAANGLVTLNYKLAGLGCLPDLDLQLRAGPHGRQGPERPRRPSVLGLHAGQVRPVPRRLAGLRPGGRQGAGQGPPAGPADQVARTAPARHCRTEQ